MRFALARFAGHILPPVFAARLTDVLYPLRLARSEARDFTARVRTGGVYRGNAADVHARYVALHGFHDWRLWVVAQTVCRAGEIVAEIGANVGTETIAFADIVGPSGRVYAFEPYPPNAEALGRTMPGHVQIVPCAVSDRSGWAGFVAPPAQQSGVGYLGDGDVKVDVVALDDYAFTGPLRFLAIDAEGHEVRILRGGERRLRTDRPVIVLEASESHLHRAGADWTDLTATLLAAGYAVMRLGRWGLTTIDREPSNWLAVPLEERALLARIDRALRRQAWSPVWRRQDQSPRQGDEARAIRETPARRIWRRRFPYDPALSELERLAADAIKHRKRDGDGAETLR